MKKVIYDHNASLFKVISDNADGWKKYGEFDEEAKSFEFFPDKIVSPLRFQFKLQESMAFTQLFVGYMEEKKDSYLNQISTANAAVFIANWLTFRWRIYCKKKTLNYLDNFALRSDWSNRKYSNNGFIGWNA